MSDKVELRVLLVEDDGENADVFRRHAEASTAYRLDVEHAPTSGQAFERLSQGGYALIFLDYVLAEPTTGLAVLRRLEAEGVETPVIVLTGRGDEATSVAMMKAGAADYLVKDTFNTEVLDRSIRYVLQQQRLSRQRDQVTEALHKADSKYALILSTLSELVTYQDTELRVVWANRAAAESAGLSADQLVGRHCYEIWPKRAEPCPRCPVMEAIRTGRPQQGEMTTPDGRVWLLSGHPVRGEAGNVVGAVEVTTEVTERKRAEQALVASELHYRSLVENAVEMVHCLNPEGELTYVSQTLQQALGYSSNELLGRHYNLIVAEQDRPRTREAFQRRLRAESVPPYDFRLLRRDGTHLPVEIVGNPIFSPDGDLIGTQAILRDITERKRAVEQVRQARDLAQKYLDVVGVILVALNEKGEVTLMNRRGCEILGCTREEIVRRNWFTHFLPADVRDDTRLVFGRLMAGETETVEYHENAILTKSGEKRLIAWHNTVLTDEASNITGILSSGVDITERKQAEEALRESEERFRLAFEEANIGMCLGGLDGRLTKVNRQMSEILGYSQAELEKMTVNDIAHPEKTDVTSAFFERALSGQADHADFERRYFHKNGHIVWGRVTSSAVRDATGNTLYFISHVQDITERKQAEEALRRSEALLTDTGRMAKVGGWEVDAKTLEVIWTEETYRIHEVPLDHKLPLEEATSFFHPDDRPKLETAIQKALEHGEPYDMELRFITATGKHLWTHTICRPLTVDGKTVKLTGTFQDITERKQAEEALRKSEERYRALTEESLTGISIIQDGRFRYVNPQVSLMTGYSAEELLGRSVLELVHEEDRTKVQEPFDQIVAGEAVQGIEIRTRRKDGELAWRRFGATAIEYGGKPAILLNSVDITQEKHLEQQLIQSEKLTAIGELVSGVAHELNNPLQAILGYTDIARGLSPEGEVRELLERIFEQTLRASSIIGNLLTFARQKEPTREPVNVNSVVTAVLDLRRYELESGNVAVVLELADDVPTGTGDFQQLESVILNLVNNADQAIREHQGKGTITLRTTTFTIGSRSWVRLEVTDDGPGIPQEHLSRVFHPFFTTKEVGKGTGLGLSVSYGIVTSHQGFIYAENRPEGGARFVVELPASSGSLPTDQGSALLPEVRPARILVVEDEEAVAHLFERLLTNDGHQVTLAGDGDEALMCLREGRFDLLLVDCKMPGMSGPELHQQVAQEFPDLTRRFLFATGDVLSADTQTFLREIEAPVLAKPFKIEEARQAVNRKLQEVQS